MNKNKKNQESHIASSTALKIPETCRKRGHIRTHYLSGEVSISEPGPVVVKQVCVEQLVVPVGAGPNPRPRQLKVRVQLRHIRHLKLNKLIE